MHPIDPIPGQVPRKVAIDRKRKEFAEYDLNDIFDFFNIDLNKEDL